jgi:hypothetical protein
LRFGFRLHWLDELLCVSYFVLIRSRLHLLVSCFFIVDLLYIFLHQFVLTVFWSVLIDMWLVKLLISNSMYTEYNSLNIWTGNLRHCLNKQLSLSAYHITI